MPAVFERIGDLGERGDFHIGARRPFIRRVEPLAGIASLQAVEEPHLRRDDEFARGRFSGAAHHPFRREDVHTVRLDVTRRDRLDDAQSAAAFRVDEELRTRVERPLQAHVLGVDPGVHMTLAHPDLHVGAAGDAADVRAQERVGQEEDL